MSLIGFFEQLESDPALLQGYMFNFQETVNSYDNLTQAQKNLLLGGNVQAIKQAMQGEDPDGARVHLFVP